LALEDLKKEGYSDIEWITGIPDHILGWEMIRAEKENETIFLSNENASGVWVTTRQVAIPEHLRTKDGLLKMVNGLFTL
ncbi:MAG: hypothetical protein V1836_01610, partial [Candidatus Aenigmatarchaeota archaeon]